MNNENEKDEAKATPKKHKIKKDYIIGGKQYHKGENFSHKNEDVIKFLTDKKII